MKTLFTAFTFSALFSVSSASAANFSISNVGVGVGDTIYTNSSNTPLSGAIVTLGVFTSGFDVAANLNNQAALISNFTTIFASGLTGTNSTSLGGSFAGYVESPELDGTGSAATITAGNSLLGVTLYSFIGNGATLATSTTFALLNMGAIRDDVPTEVTYSSNPPAAASTLIGTYGSVNGTFAGPDGGTGNFVTLQLAPIAVPEPSTALLGAIGALALLRRRR